MRASLHFRGPVCGTAVAGSPGLAADPRYGRVPTQARHRSLFQGRKDGR